MRKKHFIIIIASLVAILSGLIVSKILLDRPTKDINSILSTEAYSYLPLVAQQYIIDNYNETGEVLLTERNKQDYKYYLNPAYVDYLVSDSPQDYEVIPEEVIVDYVYENIDVAGALPSKFDLRNVSGKNFITPFKNQGRFGLCWSFATMEQAESYLMVKSNTSYNASTTKLFSTRHADYATATNTIVEGNASNVIKNAIEPYRKGRSLTSGGTFTYITPLAADGFSYANDNWINYTASETELEYSRVFSYSNADVNYELNGSINMPVANLRTASAEYKTEYLNRVKQAIMSYGGAYVATSSPGSECSVSKSSKYLIYVDNNCSVSAHALQIIGWDDSYSYSLCINRGGSNPISSNVSSCDGTVVSGTGAWLLRNSWGTSSQISYLAYDSQRTTINVARDIGIKNWDNHYRNRGTSISSLSKDTKKLYTRLFAGPEKLAKVKIDLLSQGSVYDLYVGTSDDVNNLTKVDSITADLPGLYTFDLTSKNITLSNTNFVIEVVSTTGTMTSSSMNVYTQNAVNIAYAKTYDVKFLNNLSGDNSFRFRLTTETRGLSDGTSLSFRILDSNRQNINSQYVTGYTQIAGNKVYSILNIESNLTKGDYILQTMYQGIVMNESNLYIKQNLTTIEGTGTKYDPYLIKTPEQLDLMRNDPSAYYKLNNDIDLTYDTQNPNGLFYNNGKGWEPLYSNSVELYQDLGYTLKDTYFYGNFDGDGHKIKGLYINRPNENYVGLFSAMLNDKLNEMGVENVILENPQIKGNNYVGGIAGLATGYSYTSCLTLQNIVIHNGSIQGNNYVAGIAGYVQGGGELKGGCAYDSDSYRFNMHSLYNSAQIRGYDNVAGLIGYLSNYRYQSNGFLTIHDIQNVGTIISDNNASGLIAEISDKYNVRISVNNALSTGKLTGNKTYGVYGKYVTTSDAGPLYLNNVYYSSDIPYPDPSTALPEYSNNVVKKNAYELTTLNKWTGFNDYWSQATINDKNRIPLLKGASNVFTYLNFTASSILIDLDENDQIDLTNFLNPKNQMTQNILYITNNDHISIDNNIISGNSKGITQLQVISLYDGSKYDVTVTVHKNPLITYHSGFNDETYQQVVNGNNVTLTGNRFQRTGYTFIGWNTKLDGSGISYSNNVSTNVSNDMDLYAQWEAKKYIISFNSNGGSSITPIEATYDKKIPTLGIPEKNGYLFESWCYDTNLVYPVLPDDIYDKTNNITLYAHWEAKEYTLTLDLNGGELNTNTVTVLYNEKIGVLPTPVKVRNTFIGWSTNSSGTKLVDKDTIYTDTTITKLYAIWEEVNIEVNDVTNYPLVSSALFLTDETSINGLDIKEGFTYKVFDSEGNEKTRGNIGTSDKVDFYQNGVRILSYDILIRGDVNGDGNISMMDYMMIKSSLTKKIVLSGLFDKASDVNQDGKKSMMDYMMLKYHMVKR